MVALQDCQIKPEQVLPPTTVQRATVSPEGSACLFPPAYDARLVNYLQTCSWRTVQSRLFAADRKKLSDRVVVLQAFYARHPD